MRLLIIGGTGTISSAVARLAAEMGIELYILNRGNHNEEAPAGAIQLHADICNEEDVSQKLGNLKFDTVADFIAFDRGAAERAYRLWKDRTKQYIFISSASAYQKPLSSPVITESTPLSNPFWEYSRNKIACEEYFLKQYRDNGFPVTIVRPSHTYGLRSVPVAIHGKYGSFSVIRRMLDGKPVLVHGDGSSLWTLTCNTDFASAFLGLAGNFHAIGEAYHITSDESLTWNQIYEIIGRALGVRPKLIHVPSDYLARLDPEYEGGLLGDKASTVIFDNTKIKRAVPGFHASIRFDQGIVKTLDYVLSHAECQTPDPEFNSLCDRVCGIFG